MQSRHNTMYVDSTPLEMNRSQVSIVQHRTLILWRVKVIVGLEPLGRPGEATWAPKASPARRSSAHHAPAPARAPPAHHRRVQWRPATFNCWYSNEGAKRTSTCREEGGTVSCAPKNSFLQQPLKSRYCTVPR